MYDARYGGRASNRGIDVLRVLMLGSKEYPVGSNKGDDPITSGGIEAYVENLSEALAKKRVSVTVVTRRFAGTKAEEWHNGVRIKRVPWMRGRMLRNPSFNLHSLMRAWDEDFDVIHCHGAVASLMGWFLAKTKGKPLVCTPHGVSKGQPQYGAALNASIGATERFAYKRAQCVVFLGEEERRTFGMKFGFVPNSVIIPPGIRLSKYKPLKKRSLKIVFAGRLVAVKGVRYLLDAMKSVHAELLVAGEGPESEALRRRAGTNVKFLGHRTDVAKLLAENEIFVLPSLSEGLPVALLEAMASGCACVVTDVGLPVENNKNALVVEPANASALAFALNRLLRDNKLRTKLGKNARAAAQEYSLDSLAERHKALYAGMLL
ncbi:D-inositol-3-phosphate glycosyltransferase [Candidatus Norongarragalina meridionalis]|nr:D-inositol-3-phosphate glycosyltransferase [Candidatus Norongarragalina meridionalis]